MNMYTSEIAFEEIGMSMKNAKKTDAFVPSLWESLSKREKRKFAQVMTEPIILPSADDGGWLPEWIFKSLEEERLARALGRKQELCESASNLEVALYLDVRNLPLADKRTSLQNLLPRGINSEECLGRSDES